MKTPTTVQEFSGASYWWHCWQAVKAFRPAAKTSARYAREILGCSLAITAFALLVIFFPVSVLVCGYTRKRAAQKTLKNFLAARKAE